MIVIGIDPGQNTGLAVWDSHRKCIVDAKSLDFWRATDEILRIHTVHSTMQRVKVVIENPNENRPVFAKKGADGVNQKLRVAQNVGMNKRDAQLIVEFCQHNKIEYVTVKPTSSKWDAQTCKALTKWDKTTNQHVRDAIKLCYGIQG
jgi:predicted RNase H-like nuclease (RuvC/YqgF family)